MLHLKSIDLEKVVSFEKSSFDFERGLTVIKGKNLDAKIKGQSNGAGKSLFFSSIPNVLFNASPLARRKNSKKDMLSKKESEIGLHFYLDFSKENLSIFQKPSAYSVIENGRDLGIRGIPSAEKYIKEKISSSREEFYTTAYLQSQRECSFKKGTDSDRMAFISNAFRLHSYDAIKEILAKDLKSIKDQEIEYSTLSSKKLTLQNKLKSVDWNSKKQKEYKDVCNRLDFLEDKHEKAQEEYQNTLSLRKGVLRLVDLEKELEEYRKSYQYKNHPSKQIEILQDERRQALKYESYKKEIESYRKNVSSLKRRLRKLQKYKTEKNIERLEEKYENARKDFLNLKSKKDQENDLLNQKEEIDVEIKSLLKENKCKVLPKIPEDLDTKISIYSALVDIDLKSSSSSCPLCGSSVKKDLIKEAEDELQNLEFLKKLDSLVKEKKSLKIDFVDDEKLNLLKDRYEKLEDQLKRAKEFNEKYEERLYVEKMLKNTEKPLEVKKTRPFEEVENDIELCRNILSQLSLKKELLDTYEGLEKILEQKNPLQYITKKLSSASSNFEDVKNEFVELKQKVKKYELSKNSYSLYREEIDEIDEKLKSLSSSISKKKVYEALVEAYGPKGIKILAIQNITDLLKKNLNLYSSLIFSENFKFDIEVLTTGLRILVDRGNGNISDVRLLSGSEYACFRLLLLVSMLPLIPSNRRFNFVILDEPDCHMDEQTRERFVQNMIPAIQEVIPTIVLITPFDTEYDFNRKFNVVKKKGVSYLEQV